MIYFLIRKMWKNRWMMLCLLAGNILLLGVVSATPMYTRATMERIWHQTLRQHGIDTHSHPATLDLHLDLFDIGNYQYLRQVAAPEVTQILGIPARETIETAILTNWRLTPTIPRTTRHIPRHVTLMGHDNLDERVTLVYGRLPSAEVLPGPSPGSHIIEALALNIALIRLNIIVGETLFVNNLDSEAGAVYIRVVGVYENAQEAQRYWSVLEFNTFNTLMIDNNAFRTRVLQSESPLIGYRAASQFTYMLEYTEISSRGEEAYAYALEILNERFRFPRSPWTFNENFMHIYEAYEAQIGPLAATLWVLQIPMYVLLALFIYMVSRQILFLEQNEISVFKSRGAGRLQLMGIYVLQGICIAAIAIPAGLLLGMGLVRVLGAGSGFMYLVQRAPLAVEITGEAVLYAGLAMFISFLTMFIPVIGFSRLAIVEHKLKNTRNTRKPVWQRFFLDILCFAMALYGLYSFNQQQELMAHVVRDVAFVDPLLYINSSLFILGTGLLALRVFPLLVKLFFSVFKRFWAPHTYAALLRVQRSSGEERFIMIFLIFTIAVGIFSANAARTINTNNDHLLKYLAGADLTFQERWSNNVPAGSGIPAPTQLVYTELDFDRFTQFDEVTALTRVKREEVVISVPNSRVEGVQLMAIESDTFGETVWFRNDFLPIHINYFLNALAENPNGVLLSYNFKEFLGYEIGDTIVLRADREYLRTVDEGEGMVAETTLRFDFPFSARLRVVGFVSHWPTFAPVTAEVTEAGETIHVNQYLAIANLGYLQANWGVHPYEIWMNTHAPTNAFFYDFQEANRLHIINFYDAKGAIVQSRSDPIVQGTNGMMTVGFVITLLICAGGFLIYWILSIRSRLLQFGVFRAMGMTRGRLIKLLINEQVLITFSAIALGVVIGEVTAQLFVPIIQVSFMAAQQVIPLMIDTDPRDYVMLFTVIGSMIVLCLIILGLYVTRIKIDQALKLGED